MLTEREKIQISSSELIKGIRQGKAIDILGREHFFSQTQHENRSAILFSNIEVTEDLKLENIECNEWIYFVDCKFKSFTIDGCNFKGGLDIQYSNIDRGFAILKTSVDKSLTINFCTIDNEISVFWDTFLENFKITHCTVTRNIYVNCAKIKGDLTVIYCEIKNWFHLYNKCKIGGDMIVDHVKSNDFNVEDIIILGKLNIWYCEFTKQLEVNHSTLYELNVYNVTADRMSFFENCIEERLIIQYNTVAKSIFLIKIKIEGELIITKTIRKSFSIIECTFNVFRLSELSEKLSLVISNTYFKKIITDGGYTNWGYMQWINLKPIGNAIIELNHAVMGKWDIVNCNFSNTKMIIYSSKITDTFYTNTSFPKELSVPDNIESNTDEHSIKRDGYNQLKTIAQKQNDRGLFLHYQTEELHSYKQTLKLWKDWKTIFQLSAMRVSNEYGANWWRGVLFVVAINLIFVVICFSFRPLQFDCLGIGNFINLYLSSLSLISIPKILYSNSNWEMNWFYISRIPLAFGIYQTIAAFRKFGKSE